MIPQHCLDVLLTSQKHYFEHTRTEADRVSMRSELDGLRIEVAEVRQVRDDSAADHEDERLANVGRVKKTVAKMVSSH